MMPIRYVESGSADERAKRLLSVWLKRRTPAALTDELMEHVPQLLLLSADPPADDSPEILFVGKNTFLGTLLQHQGEDVIPPKYCIDPAFRKQVKSGYRIAAQGEPVFEIIASPIAVNRHQIYMVYERLILPWKLSSGLTQLVSYVIPREIQMHSPPSSQEPKFSC